MTLVLNSLTLSQFESLFSTISTRVEVTLWGWRGVDRPLIDPPDEFAHIPSEGLVVLHLWLADVNELIRRSGIGAASHTRCFIQLMRQDRAGSREKRRESHRGSLGPESPPPHPPNDDAATLQRHLCFAVTDGQVQV